MLLQNTPQESSRKFRGCWGEDPTHSKRTHCREKPWGRFPSRALLGTRYLTPWRGQSACSSRRVEETEVNEVASTSCLTRQEVLGEGDFLH